MRNRRNYYRILHVQADAPTAIIRSSYRTLMQRLKMHPDLGGDHWNAALINEAYAVLADPAKRAAYDRELDLFRSQRGGAQPAPVAGAGQPGVGVRTACAFCGAACHGISEAAPDDSCFECGSPLSPARRGRRDGAAPRTVDRMPHEQPVLFYTAWPQPGYEGSTNDVSPHGMQLSSRFRPSLSQVLKIECTLCEAVGRVTHAAQEHAANGAAWRIGVEFLTVRFRQRRGGFVSTRA